MLLAEAQSLWPPQKAVRFEVHDPLADRQAMRDLAVWCQRFSPQVAVEAAQSGWKPDKVAQAPDCLLLDVTGCGCGLGGEQEFVENAVAALRRHGYWASAVIADTIGSAWALAHRGMLDRSGTAGLQACVVPPGRQGEALRPLPVELLRLPADVATILHDLSIFCIEQLLALPRAELPSRFGPELLPCLDRAVGTIPEMLVFEPLAEPLEACWEFEPPIADGRILTTVIGHLLERLLKTISHGSPTNASTWDDECGMVDLNPPSRDNSPPAESGHLGVQQLLCSLKLVGRDILRFPVELLHPSASQRRIMELVGLQVERLRPAEEVASVTVQAAVVAPLDFQQGELFGGSTNGGTWRREIGNLIERLSSRLGERAVLRPRLEPDHQPEHACRYDPWLSLSDRDAARDAENEKENSWPQLPDGLRPISLRRRPAAITVMSVVPGGSPRQFRWNGRQYLVKRAWGPERIETGWWRETDIHRDYYVVETGDGERFWLFRDLLDSSWQLQGVFA